MDASKTGRNVDRMDSHTAMLELTEQFLLGDVRLEGHPLVRAAQPRGVPTVDHVPDDAQALQTEPAFHVSLPGSISWRTFLSTGSASCSFVFARS